MPGHMIIILTHAKEEIIPASEKNGVGFVVSTYDEVVRKSDIHCNS